MNADEARHPTLPDTSEVDPMMTALLAPTLTGQYATRIQDVHCRLELDLDNTGCLTGAFIANDEHLEVMGGVPNAYGEVLGLIRESGGDTLAVFRAVPHARDLVLEMDAPGEGNPMHLTSAERVMFRRIES